MHHPFIPVQRLCAAVLSALLLASMLAACSSPADNGNPDVTTQASALSTDTTSTPETEPAYSYADVDYGGEEFAILNCADRYNMIYTVMPEELNGEALNDTRYKVNKTLEDRYKVKLKQTQIAYNDLLAYAQQEILSNTPVHDIFYLSGKQCASLMNSDYLYNLLEIEELNLDQPWWDQRLAEDGTLLDKYLYYASSDYNLQPFEGTTCIFFNKKMMDDLNLDALYDMVRNGTWTMDALYEYCSKAANINGDNTFDVASSTTAIYGMCAMTNIMPAFIMGCDAYYVQKDNDGMPYLSCTEERFLSVCEKIASLSSAEGLYGMNSNKQYINLFMSGRSLFIGGEIKAAANEMREMENAFGILPLPKYDEKQDSYHSNMYWASEMMCIPTTCTDLSRAAIIMDTLAYDSAEQVLPVYYERVCYKGLRDEDSIEMLELIRNTRYLNWALAYGWLDTIEPAVHSALNAGNGNLTSVITAGKKIADRLIQKTMSEMQ